MLNLVKALVEGLISFYKQFIPVLEGFVIGSLVKQVENERNEFIRSEINKQLVKEYEKIDTKPYSGRNSVLNRLYASVGDDGESNETRRDSNERLP